MKDWRAPVLLADGILAAVFYSNFLLDAVLPSDHDWSAVVSELEVPGAQTATWLRTTDVLCGVLVLLLLPHVSAGLPVGRWRRWAIWATAIFAVAGAAAGIVPLPCAGPEVCTSTRDDLQRWVHDGLSNVSQAAIFVGAMAVALACRHPGPRWMHRAALITFWVGGVIGTIAFAYFGATDPPTWQTGIAQRFQIAMTSGWIICLAVFAAGVAGPTAPWCRTSRPVDPR